MTEGFYHQRYNESFERESELMRSLQREAALVDEHYWRAERAEVRLREAERWLRAWVRGHEGDHEPWIYEGSVAFLADTPGRERLETDPQASAEAAGAVS